VSFVQLIQQVTAAAAGFLDIKSELQAAANARIAAGADGLHGMATRALHVHTNLHGRK
jgi:hypothetical protein